MAKSQLWRAGVSAEELMLTIEAELREPQFQGVSLTDAFQDIRNLILFDLTVPETALISRIKNRLRPLWGYYHGIDPIPPDSTTLTLEQDRILVASISQREYSLRTIPKIAAHFGEQNCHILCNFPELRRILPDTVGVLAWQDAPRLDLRAWRREYDSCYGQWKSNLLLLKHKFQLSPFLTQRIQLALLTATQRVYRYNQLIDALRPRAVLIDYDRNSRAACLILAAKRWGIPTFTLIHGVIGVDSKRYLFAPVLADFVLCWGEQQREQLAGFGTELNRIKTVGFHRIEDNVNLEPAKLRNRFRIRAESLVIMFASAPIETDARVKNVILFCTAVSRLPDTVDIVRLHPSESLASYREISNRFPSVLFTDNTDMTTSEAFALTDIVVAHSSGFAGEALAKNCLAVILDAVNVPIGPGEDLIHWANAPRARDAAELAAILTRIKVDEEFRTELRDGAVRYVQRMFGAVGEAACRNIAEVVLAHALPASK